MGRMTVEQRQLRAADRKASERRMKLARAETLGIVIGGRCPTCGAGLRRNLALSGWWQCAQYGAEGFRADSSKPSCSWQGFTE
jgi:hypothetical protein